MTPILASTLSEQTLISVGALVLLGVPILGGLFKLVAVLLKILGRLEAIETRLEDEWTLKDQKIWELELRNANGSLVVPDSIAIHQGGGSR